MPRRVIDRRVEVVAFDDVEPGHPLLRFGERPIGDEQLTLADSHGRRILGWPQPLTELADAATLAFLQPSFDRVVLLALRIGLGIGGDEEHVLHGSSCVERYADTTIDNRPETTWH